MHYANGLCILLIFSPMTKCSSKLIITQKVVTAKIPFESYKITISRILFCALRSQFDKTLSIMHSFLCVSDMISRSKLLRKKIKNLICKKNWILIWQSVYWVFTKITKYFLRIFQGFFFNKTKSFIRMKTNKKTLYFAKQFKYYNQSNWT